MAFGPPVDQATEITLPRRAGIKRRPKRRNLRRKLGKRIAAGTHAPLPFKAKPSSSDLTARPAPSHLKRCHPESSEGPALSLHAVVAVADCLPCLPPFAAPHVAQARLLGLRPLTFSPELSSRPERPGFFLRTVFCAPGRVVEGPWQHRSPLRNTGTHHRGSAAVAIAPLIYRPAPPPPTKHAFVRIAAATTALSTANGSPRRIVHCCVPQYRRASMQRFSNSRDL
jgi:hypothetical protein